MSKFDDQVCAHQLRWRAQNITDERPGTQNGKQRPWILHEDAWILGLWPGIQDTLPRYLAEFGISRHRGCHNLKSSWMLCANLYFPFREGEGRDILAAFLRHHVAPDLALVSGVELEYAESGGLNPNLLLGEPGGTRGANQTSPDVAFLGRTTRGRVLILTEVKYTEHSFYSCSGYDTKKGNPDRSRCLDAVSVLDDPTTNCWQMRWEQGRRRNRKYWTHLTTTEFARQHLTRCPASTHGYQLFRQQALAEGIAASGEYDRVFSCVAWDERNPSLRNCLRATGLGEFSEEWGKVFDGQAEFRAFTHQSWVQWVREHDDGTWSDWLEYIGERYGYTG